MAQSCQGTIDLTLLQTQGGDFADAYLKGDFRYENSKALKKAHVYDIFIVELFPHLSLHSTFFKHDFYLQFSAGNR
jgi:uncharacterized protein YfdQ (DUF2303 family)